MCRYFIIDFHLLAFAFPYINPKNTKLIVKNNYIQKKKKAKNDGTEKNGKKNIITCFDWSCWMIKTDR